MQLFFVSLMFFAVLLPFAVVALIIYVEFKVVRPRSGTTLKFEERVRAHATKKYFLGISRSNVLIIVVAFSSALISLGSAYVSYSTEYEVERHNELLMKPHIEIASGYNETGTGFMVDSNGLGPAIQKWGAVWLDGNPEKSWDSLNTDLKYPGGAKVTYRFTNFSPESHMAALPDKPAVIYWIPINVGDKDSFDNAIHLKNNIDRIRIDICYCSIYQDQNPTLCWQASNSLKNNHAKCDTPPAVLLTQ